MLETINEFKAQMSRLQQKHDKFYTRRSLLFTREAHKVLKDDFSPELALCILKDALTKASPQDIKEWKTRAKTFPLGSRKTHKKPPQDHATDHQVGTTGAETHAHL